MELNVELTRKDVLICQALHLLVSLPFIYSAIGLALTIFFAQLYFMVGAISLVGLGGALLVALFVTSGCLLLVVALAGLTVDTQPAVLGHKTVRLSGSHLQLNMVEGSENINWRNVRRVRQLGSYLTLQTSRHDVIVLPARCFASREHLHTFVETINTYRLNAGCSVAYTLPSQSGHSPAEPSPDLTQIAE